MKLSDTEKQFEIMFPNGFHKIYAGNFNRFSIAAEAKRSGAEAKQLRIWICY